jgi:anaerobic selenocysteine-containing dehydrogenase
LLADRFPTSDGRSLFSAVDLPEEKILDWQFFLTTRRGKQFNSIIHSNMDPITGARRDEVMMSPEDAARFGPGEW